MNFHQFYLLLVCSSDIISAVTCDSFVKKFHSIKKYTQKTLCTKLFMTWVELVPWSGVPNCWSVGIFNH